METIWTGIYIYIVAIMSFALGFTLACLLAIERRAEECWECFCRRLASGSHSE